MITASSTKVQQWQIIKYLIELYCWLVAIGNEMYKFALFAEKLKYVNIGKLTMSD